MIKGVVKIDGLQITGYVLKIVHLIISVLKQGVIGKVMHLFNVQSIILQIIAVSILEMSWLGQKIKQYQMVEQVNGLLLNCRRIS